MRFVRFVAAVLCAIVLAGPALAAERTIIILDASGSMWGQIGGRPKLEIARETLRSVLQSLPADMELGFMAYGHREKGSCSDIELLVPPAAGTEDAIAAAADRLQFLGKTPLSAAVRKAAEALKYTEDKATVVLITDGIETCDADPCALGRELKQSGVDFTAHVVGFGLSAQEGAQVACLAENTGGRYFQASDAGQLKDALQQAVVAQPAPEPPAAPEPAAPEFNFMPQTVLADGQEPLRDAGNSYEIYRAKPDGTKGERVTTEYSNWKGNLEPGAYVVRATQGHASVEQSLTIEPGKVYEPLFVLNAGMLVVRPRPSEGADPDTGAAVVVDYPGAEFPATYYGESRIVLPAGAQKLKVSIGQGSVETTVTLRAGETLEQDIVVGVGHVVANALYAAGGDRVEDGMLFTRIVKAKTNIDGSREDVANAYGPDARFDVPPGDYVAVLQMDKATGETPFTVRAGEAVDLTAVLDAGVLAITAPGASMIEVFGAKKDIQGKRTSFGNAYADTYQTTLPAGDYVVVKTLGDSGGTSETPATVKAGERTETTAN